VVAGVEEGGDGEAAAGGLAGEGDVRRGGAGVQEGLVGGQGVVDGGGVGVLGGQAVVDGDASSAAWTASPRTYTPPWKYRTVWRGSVPLMVIWAVGTPPRSARVTVMSLGSGCAEISSLSSRRCSLMPVPGGKADCRRIASRFSACSVLTEDSPFGRARLPATLAARQVNTRHLITVIRAIAPPQVRPSANSRECAGSGPNAVLTGRRDGIEISRVITGTR
jgi:hypothetical protein